VVINAVVRLVRRTCDDGAAARHGTPRDGRWA